MAYKARTLYSHAEHGLFTGLLTHRHYLIALFYPNTLTECWSHASSSTRLLPAVSTITHPGNSLLMLMFTLLN
jgi:hypothetical protein